MDVKLIHRTENAEQLIGYMARVSSPNQSNPEVTKLLKYLIREKHWSPFEMATMCIEIKTSRAIAQQILRHRSFTFQEFCISGDTEISTRTKSGSKRKRTIKELYDLQNGVRWERLVTVYDEESKSLVTAKIKEVFKTGFKELFEVVLDNGKKIKSTKEHKFLTREGFKELGSLTESDYLGTNGLECYKSYGWMTEAKSKSIKNGTGLEGIAKEANVSTHTIRKWLQKHKLQFTKKEVSLYTPVWNKGLPSHLQPSFGNFHSLETRKKMQESSRKGKDSNLFKNGKLRAEWRKARDWSHKNKSLVLEKDQNQCVLCKDTTHLQIDHIKPFSQNPELGFEFNNLQTLCKKCHSKKSAEEIRLVPKWSKIVSITSVGFEETYDMEIDHSSHNYIANGIITHNSQRYSSVENEVELSDARRQDLKNRQNSVDDLSYETKQWFKRAQEEVNNLSMELYQEALGKGIAKECARFLLPLSTQTKIYMHGNLRDWIFYLNLRTGNGTQIEHAEIASAIKQIFIEQFPTISEALEWTNKN